MSNQCQSCGAFDDLKLCEHCKKAELCARCRIHHGQTCEVAMQRKARGEGPTVRQQVLRSIVPDIVATIPGPTKVTTQLQDDEITQEFLDGAGFVIPPGAIITGLTIEAINAELALIAQEESETEFENRMQEEPKSTEEK